MSHSTKSDIPEIDVCVITYRRPLLLKKLLNSLDRQSTFGLFTYRVIVVDNDRQQTAKTVVREIEPISCSINYAVEPEKNIALARNKSLNLCTGDYIATIDDDAWADKRWLLNLYLAALKYRADIVFGRIKPSFPPNTPEYFIKNITFNSDRLHSGSIVSLDLYKTGNSFFKRSVIERTSVRFDPQFGETGGEDTRFFIDLTQKGYLAVWSDEATVFHYYPPDRIRLRWMLQRNFRIGNNGRYILGDNHWLMIKSSIRIIQLIHVFKKTSKVTFEFLGNLLYSVTDKEYKIDMLNQLCSLSSCIGEMSSILNYRYREYR